METKFTVDAKELMALSNFTDSDRPRLSGIHVKANGSLTLEATNGHVLGRIYSESYEKVSEDFEYADFMFPVSEMMPVLKEASKAKIGPKCVVVTVTKGEFIDKVKCEYFGTSVSCDSPKDEFPDTSVIESVIPAEIDTMKIAFPLLMRIGKFIETLSESRKKEPVYIPMTFTGTESQVYTRLPHLKAEIVFMPSR
jgi:hypothetical protein